MRQVFILYETTMLDMSCACGRHENSTNAAVRTVEEARKSLSTYEAMIKTSKGIR